MRTSRSVTVIAISLIILAAGAISLARRLGPPALARDEVREALYSTIQRETPASFLVTGTLDIIAETEIEASRRLLPGIVGLNLGTSRASVRVPGRVSYGFDLDQLEPDMISFLNDTIIELRLPELSIHSVEPRLSGLEVATERGWTRWSPDPDSLEQQALSFAENALRRQALAHLQDSLQPRINTAAALERMMRPVLDGLGHPRATVNIRISPRVTVSPAG